jgi:predicted nucleotidyltransferase
MTNYNFLNAGKIDFLEIAKSIIKSHLAAYPGTKACIFGSRARGTARLGSDLDIGLWRTDGQPVSLFVQGTLKDEIEESIVPYNIDVVDIGSADSAFRQRVLADAVNVI